MADYLLLNLDGISGTRYRVSDNKKRRKNNRIELIILNIKTLSELIFELFDTGFRYYLPANHLFSKIISTCYEIKILCFYVHTHRHTHTDTAYIYIYTYLHTASSLI